MDGAAPSTAASVYRGSLYPRHDTKPWRGPFLRPSRPGFPQCGVTHGGSWGWCRRKIEMPARKVEMDIALRNGITSRRCRFFEGIPGASRALESLKKKVRAASSFTRARPWAYLSVGFGVFWVALGLPGGGLFSQHRLVGNVRL